MLRRRNLPNKPIEENIEINTKCPECGSNLIAISNVCDDCRNRLKNIIIDPDSPEFTYRKKCGDGCNPKWQSTKQVVMNLRCLRCGCKFKEVKRLV